MLKIFALSLSLLCACVNLGYSTHNVQTEQESVKYKESSITTYNVPFEASITATQSSQIINYVSRNVVSKTLAFKFPTYTYNPQPGACACVAGGNVLGFFDRYDEDLIPNHSSGTVIGNTYSYSFEDSAVRDVIEQLYVYMGTSSTGTTESGFIQGITDYCKDKNKTVTFTSCMSSGSFSFSLAKSYLETNQPIILFLSGYNVGAISEGSNKDTYAIIYDMDKASEIGSYIQTVEAVGGGVQCGFLDDTRIVDFKIKILRVKNATETIIEQAKYFCHQQLGKEYFLNPFRLNTDINSEQWYCSELMYAAYNYAGLDIGVKYDKNGNDVFLSLGCIPSDIYNSYNTSEVILGHAETSYFLELQIVDKARGTWTIEVRNHTNSAITFEYNEKMCFKGDAQNWTGLKDIQQSDIEAGETVQIQISENVFATSIAASWIYKNIRYVSLAYDLNNNTKTMKVEYVTIDLLT